MKQQQGQCRFFATCYDESLALTRRHAQLLIGHWPALQDFQIALANGARTFVGFVYRRHRFSSSNTAWIIRNVDALLSMLPTTMIFKRALSSSYIVSMRRRSSGERRMLAAPI